MKKKAYRLITQDISLYLVASTECSNEKYFKKIKHYSEKGNQINNNSADSEIMNYRALCTLDTLKRRIWKCELPLVTEREITKTGPWILKANEYHNHTYLIWKMTLVVRWY